MFVIEKEIKMRKLSYGINLTVDGCCDHNKGAGSDEIFTATEVLAKHDETYMPPEVAKALKESGRWQEGENGQPVNGQPAEGEQTGGTTLATRSTAKTTTETNP